MSVETHVKRCDRYPVGTSVGLYPASASHAGEPIGPSGSAIENVTVDSFGVLTFTLEPDTAYVAYAKVAGEDRYLKLSAGTYTAPGTLKERIEARRAEVGA